MIGTSKVVVVMPAYNAEETLRQTVLEIDRSVVDRIQLPVRPCRDCHPLDRMRVRFALNPHGLCDWMFGKNLERQFGHHAESAHAADEELRDVKTGRVLDDFAAGPDLLSIAADEVDSQYEIADASVAKSAWPGESRGNRAANRGSSVD